MAEELPDDAEAALTDEVTIAHLATAYDDRPHAAPIWYNYRDGEIEIVTTGTKLENVRRNPRVAMSIQQDNDGEAQWGLTLRGTTTVVEDDAEDREIRRRINSRYGADEDEWDENTAVRIDVGSANYWTYD